MPERFKVVFTMQGAIQVLGFTFYLYHDTDYQTKCWNVNWDHSTHCVKSYKLTAVEGLNGKLAVVLQTFRGQNYFFFQNFQGILFIFI